MNETSHSQSSPAEQDAAPKRRPWHAPQFFVAEYAATSVVTNGMSDGALAAPSES